MKIPANGSCKPSSIGIALRALRREIAGFTLNDPYEVDFSAGLSNSLHYPVYSDRLSWESMRLDSAGIPQTWNRVTGTKYWPAYVAWYGLVQLGHYHRGKGSAYLDAFLKQVDWLEQNATIRKDGSVVWEMNFDYPEDGIVLRAPWVSAHAQGLAISAIVRGWRITRRPRLQNLLSRSAGIFELDVGQGGVRAQIDGNTFYTEIPGGSLPGILDGFLVSLVGLHDLFTETGDRSVGRLLTNGIEGLRNLLPWWDYRNKWSWYGSRLYLCPPLYHCWNRALLSVIGDWYDAADLTRQAQRWNPAQLSRSDRAEIYVAFLATKNESRIRRRTWLLKTLP